MARIAVVGSVNMDIVNQVETFPQPGETIHGRGTAYHPGGKGANQAVAVARAGGSVGMAGAVGHDPFGETLLDSLRGFGVDTSGMCTKEGTSGLAFITVNAAGENTIILSAGSNGKLRPEDIDKSCLEGIDLVLLQNEIPWETNVHVMRLCNKLNVQVFYNPAPAHQLPADVFRLIDTIILNETEAELITGLPITDAASVGRAAELLLGHGVRRVVITLGSEGLYYAEQNGTVIVTPAFKVTAVDTTAAGDTFIGAFAAASLMAFAMPDKLRFASAAAALTVTREGAQSSIPAYEDIIAMANLS